MRFTAATREAGMAGLVMPWVSSPHVRETRVPVTHLTVLCVPPHSSTTALDGTTGACSAVSG